MKLNAAQTIAAAGALVVTVVFVKLIHDMGSSMEEMTGHVGAISREVKGMRADMREITVNIVEMNENMARMEASMRGMGRAFSQGSEQIQQWNPAQMMKQVVPAQPRGSR